MLTGLDEVLALTVDRPRTMLIGIDGLPVAGKSTFARGMSAAIDGICMSFDDFIRPEADWPSWDRPAFPFEYARHDDFVSAVRALANEGRCEYLPFDWDTRAPARRTRVVERDRPVIVEGVSALSVELAPLYDLRIWVESDAASTLAASIARGVGPWLLAWERLFLPSVERYLRTDPRSRADVVVAGRMGPTEANRPR